MKISKRRLAQIIREEKRKLFYESNGDAVDPADLAPGEEEEAPIVAPGEGEGEEEDDETIEARTKLAAMLRKDILDSKGIIGSEFKLFYAAVNALMSGFEQKNLASKKGEVFDKGFDRLWKTLGITGVETAAPAVKANESKKLAKRLLRNRKRRR